MRAQGPSNINAASSEEVQNSTAIAALLEQSEFSSPQRIGGNFWGFPIHIIVGNVGGACVYIADIDDRKNAR